MTRGHGRTRAALGRAGLGLLVAAAMVAAGLGQAAAAREPRAGTGSTATGGTQALPGSPLPFTDVGGDPWAIPSVALLAAQGVTEGVSATAFAPDQPLTAEAAVTLLSRLFLAPSTPPPAHPLAGVDNWAQAAVAWADQKGIVANPGSFAATQPAPRDAVVAWTVRALGLLGSAPPAPTFKDAAAIPPSYAPAVGVAQADGLVVGDGSGNFDPTSPITRAQMAVILVRAERALAEAHATGSAAPFSWQTGPNPTVLSTPLSGTGQVASASLPTGSVTGGAMSGIRGFAETFAADSHMGAGTMTLLIAGTPVRAPFVWQTPATAGAEGEIWIYIGATPAVYTYTDSAGDLAVRPLAGPATLIGGSLILQTKAGAAGTETASGSVATPTATATATASGTAAAGTYMAYNGPALPDPALLLSQIAAAALVVGIGAGG